MQDLIRVEFFLILSRMRGCVVLLDATITITVVATAHTFSSSLITNLSLYFSWVLNWKRVAKGTFTWRLLRTSGFQASYHTIVMFCLLSDGLCCPWLVCWYRCPESGSSSIDWAQMRRFYLKTETESRLRNVVLKYKQNGVLGKKKSCKYNVRKHSIYIKIAGFWDVMTCSLAKQ
jgi:hypothetical protein